MAFLIGAVVSRQDLLEKYTIMADIDLTKGFLVIGGVYAATFSSALASIVGAPQLLSSVARDNLFGFLSYFAVTHKREGFRFIRAPFVDGVSETFLRKLKWFLLAQVLYSEDESHGDALYESWKKLRKLFVGRLDADKMKELIVKRNASRVTGTTWTFQDKIEPYTRKDMETMSSEELECILVDDLVEHLERPHTDIVERFMTYVLSECEKSDRGDSERASTGLIRARELKEILSPSAESNEFHDVSKLLQSAKFNSDHMVTFVMNADVNDEPNRKIRYGKVVKIADPIRGYFVSYIIASCFIIMGDLNAVAPLISMFFMMT